MDRVVSIKARQQANILFNGLVINSNLIINIGEDSVKPNMTEIIRELSMGFFEGVEILSKYYSRKKWSTFFSRIKQ